MTILSPENKTIESKRENKKDTDKGIGIITFTPESQSDIGELVRSFPPEMPRGYEQFYEWGTHSVSGRPTLKCGVRLTAAGKKAAEADAKKLAGQKADAGKSGEQLSIEQAAALNTASDAELETMAVELGIEKAANWSKDRLRSEIAAAQLKKAG